MIAHFARMGSAVGAVALVSIAIWGVGGLFQKHLREVDSLLPSECAALRFLGGAGLLGLITFLVGLFHFSVTSSAVLLLGGAARNFRDPWCPRFRAPRSAGLWFTFFIVALLVISGLAQPVGESDADEITYHLLGPPIWLREHRIAPVLEESLTAFPATIETLFGLASVISNDSAPGALGAIFFGAFVLQVRGVARRIGGGVLGGDLAAAFVAGMPAVTSTVDCCFVDVPYAAFVLAAARLAFESGQARHAILAGIFAGFAAGTKYFGLSSGALIAVLGVFFQTGRIANRLRNFLVFAVVATATGAAWYVRNWLVLGNPIYPPPPFTWQWFSTPNFSREATDILTARLLKRGNGFGKGVLDLLLLPFQLTYWTAWFHGGGGMGVAPLAFGPAALALVWKHRAGAAWAALAALLTIFWFYSDQEFRFLDPAVGIFAAFAGVGAEALLRRRDALTRWPAFAAIGLSLGLGGAHALSFRSARLFSVFSPARAEARLENGIPHRNAFEFLNSHAEVQKVFFCHPYTTVYYLKKPYTVAFGRLMEQPHADIRTVADAVGKIRKLGVTHVFDLNFFGSGFAWPQTGAGRLVYEEKDVRIYACEAATAQ